MLAQVAVQTLLRRFPVVQPDRNRCAFKTPPARYNLSPETQAIGTLCVAGKRNRTINLPAPYLRRVWLDRAQVRDAAAYPFCLPFLAQDFELGFDQIGRAS